MSNKDNLGELIKAALRAEKITQDELAGKMGVSRQTVNNHLSKRKIDKDFLLSLKELTGIDFTNYYETENIGANSDYPKPNKLIRILNLDEFLKVERTDIEIKNYFRLLREAEKNSEDNTNNE